MMIYKFIKSKSFNKDQISGEEVIKLSPILSDPYYISKDLGLSCVSAEDQFDEGFESPVT